MKGIIIAGGLGTRLRPLTYRRPKPLVPLANRPFLEYQVALLKQHGIDDIVFATNYMADRIETHFGDGSRFGVRMRYALEETPLGTGGAIRNAADLFPGETVVVFNGDILTDFDLSTVMRLHESKRAVATITLAKVPSPNPFGVLLVEPDGHVREWREPSEEAKKALIADQEAIPTGKDLINAGFYVLSPDAVSRIPHGVASSIERQIFPALIAEDAGVYGVAPGGFWMDVGRPAQLLEATRAVLLGEVRSVVPTERMAPGARIAESAWIDAHSSVGRACVVGEGSRVEESILMDGVNVGHNVLLRGVIVDEDARIEDEVVLDGQGQSPVIAAESMLKRGTRL